MTKVDSELVEGFAAVPRWIMRTMDLTAHELAVLLVLAGRVNASGLCWPSHETIADEAGCGEKTVRRALGSLRDKNLVTWRQQVRGDGGVATNMYMLHLDAPIAASTPRSQVPGPSVRETDEVTT